MSTRLEGETVSAAAADAGFRVGSSRAADAATVDSMHERRETLRGDLVSAPSSVNVSGSILSARRSLPTPDSLRLPRWTLWSEFRLAKLGGWVVGRNVSEGGWSDVVTLDW